MADLNFYTLAAVMVVLSVGFMGTMVRRGFYRAKKHQDEMAGEAARIGFTFESRSPMLRHASPFSRECIASLAQTLKDTAGRAGSSAPDRYTDLVAESRDYLDFEIFKKSGRIGYVMKGRAAGTLTTTLADYTYVEGSGKHRTTYQQTLAFFYLQGKVLPAFLVKPETILHKIGAIFGYQDIDFALNPEFSKHYLLRGAHEPSIRALFNPSILNFFSKNPGWCVEGRGECLLVYTHGVLVQPDRIKDHLDACAAVVRNFYKV